MAQCIANPIYDAAFKFLMEDDRCVKILLSALLKKDVVAVKVRPHEYTEKKEKRISIYRVDFGATIRENAPESDYIVNLGDRDFSDHDTQTIINRLAFAAADPEIRYAMNVEEEILGELEGLDTKIEIAKDKLQKAESLIAENEIKLAEQSTQLAEQNSIILTTAKALKQAGMSDSQVAEMTKLSEDVIKGL